MVAIDFTTLIDGYAMLLGDPILIGMFLLVISGIISARMGVSTPFMFTCGLVLIWLLVKSTSAFLPEALWFGALFLVGLIIYMGLKQLKSRF